MAWEWVAPVVTGAVGATGVVFTWLTGRQARQHLEAMAERNYWISVATKRDDERRDAYFSILRVAELDLRRNRYEQRGREDKLRAIDEHWSKARRVEMYQDAVIAVELFGSSDARQLVEHWSRAAMGGDAEQLIATYEAFRDMARRELGVPDALLPKR